MYEDKETVAALFRAWYETSGFLQFHYFMLVIEDNQSIEIHEKTDIHEIPGCQSNLSHILS